MSRPTSGGLAFPKRPTVSPLATGAYALFVRRYINNEIFRNGNAPVPPGDPNPRSLPLSERLLLGYPARGSLAISCRLPRSILPVPQVVNEDDARDGPIHPLAAPFGRIRSHRTRPGRAGPR